MAIALQDVQHGAFGDGFLPGARVVEAGGEVAVGGVVVAALQDEGAGADGGHHDVGVDRVGTQPTSSSKALRT